MIILLGKLLLIDFILSATGFFISQFFLIFTLQ